jgi:hypothetical protein
VKLRFLIIAVIFLALLYVSSRLFVNRVQYPIAAQPPIEHMQSNLPALIKQYVIDGRHPDYKSVVYRPRQFAPEGAYHEWDMITANTPMRLYLNRPATIATVVRVNAAVPAWVSGWRKAAQVTMNGARYDTYKKVVDGSTVNVGGHGAYTLLLAEKNGSPSTPPKTPVNLPVPVPNKTCPSWVHDVYKARGPDGKLYPSWHPQIDPVYRCYFNHEHGVDPSLFTENYRIPFGYAGGRMGMPEAHAGFKSYVWDDNYGHVWLALQHQGTSTNQGACGRHHELDVVARDKRSGEIVSEQYFVGDYGISRPLTSAEPFRPSNCPDQGKIEPGNSGIRFLPVKGYGTVLEEPWTVNRANVIGFNFADFTVNTFDPVRICADLSCDSVVYTGGTGTNRSISYVSGFGPKSGAGHSGIYHTDPMGKTIISADRPGAVRQYIKPGVSISSNIPYTSQQEASCRDVEGSGGIMQCGLGLTGISSMRENSITIPN